MDKNYISRYYTNNKFFSRKDPTFSTGRGCGRERLVAPPHQVRPQKSARGGIRVGKWSWDDLEAPDPHVRTPALSPAQTGTVPNAPSN